METITCLNRWLGRCRNCSPDFDPTHFPNNYHCPEFKAIHIRYFEVREKEDGITKKGEEKS